MPELSLHRVGCRSMYFQLDTYHVYKSGRLVSFEKQLLPWERLISQKVDFALFDLAVPKKQRVLQGP